MNGRLAPVSRRVAPLLAPVLAPVLAPERGDVRLAFDSINMRQAFFAAPPHPNTRHSSSVCPFSSFSSIDSESGGFDGARRGRPDARHDAQGRAASTIGISRRRDEQEQQQEQEQSPQRRREQAQRRAAVQICHITRSRVHDRWRRHFPNTRVRRATAPKPRPGPPHARSRALGR